MIDYQHLWSGTEPGWVVNRHVEDRVGVTLLFPAGASMRDVRALRAALPEFGARSAAEVLSEIRGRTELPLGDFESREARAVVHRCTDAGLHVREDGYQRVTDLLFNEVTCVALPIEEESLNRQVVREALRHGLPLRHSTS